MQRELKCPKCGNVFTVDENDYAQLLNQVRTAEFNSEVEQRLHEQHARWKAEHEAQEAKNEKGFQTELGKRERTIADRDATIAELKQRLMSIEKVKDAELKTAIAQKDIEIGRLSQEKELAVRDEQQKVGAVLQERERTIADLKAQQKIDRSEAEATLQRVKAEYDIRLKAAGEELERVKDMRARLSTKMVGETLEQHCNTLFETMLRPFMPNAYFEKDNDASGGSKGDFIFRDSEDGFEYISIMFEMKNEMDETATKHRNDDFLRKLDADRNAKHCEFAVLVSLLERDSELYNSGIVDVSHRYPKMYVIRPQFFVPLITLLVQTSKKSVELRRQLAIAQTHSVDVTNFEKKLLDFKEKFGSHYEKASKKFEDAIKQIDDTIAKLIKVRESLVGSENYLRLANKDTDNLTIKRLTHGNPTMKAKFDDARAQQHDQQ